MKSKTYPKRRWIPDDQYRAEQARWKFQAVYLGQLLTAKDMEAATVEAWSLPQLFALARKRAAEHELVCAKCGGELITEASMAAENPKPFTATKPEESNDHEIPS